MYLGSILNGDTRIGDHVVVPVRVIRCATHGRNDEVPLTVSHADQWRAALLATFGACCGENDHLTALPDESVFAVGGDIALDMIGNGFPRAGFVVRHSTTVVVMPGGSHGLEGWSTDTALSPPTLGAMATILSIITALVVGGSGVYDFMNPPQTVQLMHDLGYKPGFHRTLGIIKLAGAIGLLLGLQALNLGLLASIGLVAYFGLAVRAHRKLAHETNEFIPAIALLALSAITFLALLFS